jgi:hypothetical protein
MEEYARLLKMMSGNFAFRTFLSKYAKDSADRTASLAGNTL